MAALGRLCRFAVSLSAQTRHLRGITLNPGRNGMLLGKLPLRFSSGYEPSLLSRHLSSTPVSRQVASERGARPGVESEQGTSLEEMIADMVHQERRFGNVDSHLFNKCLEHMKQTEFGAYEALQLIRATRSIVQLPASQRHQLFETVWSQIQEKGVVLDISHYNAALRAKLENKITIVPTEFLLEVEEKGIAPNRVTYELLIAGYCERGDVEGARQILEFLKQKDLPINIVVFNTLIKGHLRKGDVDGARGMLEDMREAGLEPNGDTYKVLMCGYAERGDMDTLRETLTETKEDVVLLTPHHLFSIVYSLAAHGHSQHIEEMLDVIRESCDRYQRDGKNCMSQMMATGLVGEAFTVYRGLLSSQGENQEGPSVSGPVFLRLLVDSHRPYEEVVTYITKLKEAGELTESVSNVLNWTLSLGDTEYCREVIKHKQDEGESVESTVFVSNLRKLLYNREIEGVYSLMKLMFQTCPTDRLLLDILFREAVMPLILQGESEETLITRLQECGYPSQDLDQLRALVSIVEGRYEDTINLLNSGTIVRPGQLKKLLPGSFSTSGSDAQGLAQILQKAAHNMGEGIAHTTSSVMLDIIQQSGARRTTVSQQLIQAYTDMKVPIMDKFRDPIMELLSSDVPETTIKDFEVLMEDSKKFKLQKFKYWSKMGVAELEQEHSSLAEKGGHSFPLETTLLSKYCSAGDQEKAGEITSLLDKQGYRYSPSDYRSLAILAARNNDLQGALHYKHKMESEDPEFTSYEALVLQIARLQLQEGQAEGALELLREFVARPGVQEARGEQGGYSHLCKRLADLSLERCPPLTTRELVDTLYDTGYIGTADPSLLGYIVRAQVNSDDDDGALEAFSHCLSKYDKPVWLRGLVRRFVEKEDSQRLQKLIDSLPASFNEADVWASIACRFIESGKLKKARKVLQNPQLKVEMRALISECHGWLVQKRVKEMEQLVEETRSLPNIDREEMLFQLMRIYVAVQEFDKAQDVLLTCEEESVIPRDRTFRYLAKVLRAEGIAVPFHVPEVPANDRKRQVRPASGYGTPASRPSPKTPDSTQSTKTTDSKDTVHKMNLEQVVDFVKDCLSRKQVHHKNINQAMSGLSLEGLKELQSITHPDLCGEDSGNNKIKSNITRCIHRNIMRAYLESDTADDMVEELTSHPEMVETGLTTQIVLTAFTRGQQLTEKLRELLVSHSDKDEVFSRLLYVYIIQGDREHIDSLLERRPHFTLNLGYVCRHALLNDKEDVLTFVLERFGHLHKSQLADVYNQGIHLKCNKKDCEGALHYYHRAQEQGYTTQELSPHSLHLLEKLLIENNQPLPWPVGSLPPHVTRSRRAENRNTTSSRRNSLSKSIDNLI